MVKLRNDSPKKAPAKASRYFFVKVPARVTENLGILVVSRIWNGTKDDFARLGINNVFSSYSDANVLRKHISKFLGLTLVKA